MTLKTEEIEAALIDDVCSRVREKLEDDEAQQVEEFVRQYYRRVPPDDLVGRSELDVYGAALAHWNFMRRRMSGEAKVRVYNPQFEQHGWQSAHTVVEIVTDDMPFLVDSVSMELGRHGYGIHLLIRPIISVRRDEGGELVELASSGADQRAESVMHVEIDRQSNPRELDALRGHLARALGEVRAAVEDWPRMRERAQALIAELEEQPPPVDRSEVEEAKALLAWLEHAHFTFLGYREYNLVTEDGEDRLRAVGGSGLGILRETGAATVSQGFAKLPPHVRALARAPRLLNLTKANARATVHRASYLDYVGVKRYDPSGEVVGERRFLGLYTTAAYKASPRDIPVVRRKVEAVLGRAAFPAGGHDDKALVEILETYPRDELFQIAEDQLFEIAMGILGLGERQRVKLFVRRDEYERFLSCLLFLPRDRFNTQNRERAQDILAQAFNAESADFELRLSESVLVRIHLVVHTRRGPLPDYDVDELERRIVEATRSWTDQLYDALIDERGEERGNDLFRRYGLAFPVSYRDDWVARSAVADIERIEQLHDGDGLGMSLYRPLEARSGALRCKLFRADAPVSL